MKEFFTIYFPISFPIVAIVSWIDPTDVPLSDWTIGMWLWYPFLTALLGAFLARMLKIYR